jgi:hypothetical protein
MIRARRDGRQQPAEGVGIQRARRARSVSEGAAHSRPRFGGFDRDIAAGLAIRHDPGSRHVVDAFQKELAFLGVASAPAFVRAPEGNGCAERFIRASKENLLWLRSFESV